MTARQNNSACRVLVLGCGSIGRRHIGNLRQLGAGRVLVYDVSAARREAVASEFDVQAYGSLAGCWGQNPNVVVIAAPTQFHVALATESARRGCQVFVEKPLSHSLDGLDDLCTEVDRRCVATMVGCNMRFHPGPMTVRRWLDDGVIGAVLGARLQTGSYLPRWRPQQDYRESYSAHVEWGGAILDCIHEIDLALWYLGPGELVCAATGPARSIGLETDGLSELILRHESGAISNVHLNFVQRDYRRSCQIIGSEGTIYWDEEHNRVVLYGQDGRIIRQEACPKDYDLNQMYVEEIGHFLQAVQTKSPTVNPLRDAMDTLRIALAARQTEVGVLA
jgi:predicted dehydrogenase